MSRKTNHSNVRSASRELFAVMNDWWKIRETSSGLYELSARDGSSKLAPIDGKSLTGLLAVISELDRHLHVGR